MSLSADDLSDARRRNRAAVERLFAQKCGPPSAAASASSRGHPRNGEGDIDGGRAEWRVSASGGRSQAPVGGCGTPLLETDPHRSCRAMQMQKMVHNLPLREGGPGPVLSPVNNTIAAQAARRRRAAILRQEGSLARRRAVDRYIDLTEAQLGLSLTRLNDYTAARLAARFGGRWALDNPHHQELLRGEPVMNRIMRGEFYNPGKAKAGPGKPTKMAVIGERWRL